MVGAPGDLPGNVSDCEVACPLNNMTYLFQPLDITVNKVAKSIFREGYSQYYSNEVQAQLQRGIRPVDVKVDLKILTLKPLHARWIENIYETMKNKSAIIIKGFDKAGILAALDSFRSFCFLKD